MRILITCTALAVLAACGAAPLPPYEGPVLKRDVPFCGINKDETVARPETGEACVWESDTRGGQATLVIVFAEGEMPPLDDFGTMRGSPFVAAQFDVRRAWEKRVREGDGHRYDSMRSSAARCSNVLRPLSAAGKAALGVDGYVQTCQLMGTNDRRVPICMWGERQGKHCLMAEDAEPTEVTRPEEERAFRILVSLHQDPVEENLAFGVVDHLKAAMPNVGYEPACRVEYTFYSASVRERHEAGVLLVFCVFGDSDLLAKPEPDVPVDDGPVNASQVEHLGSGKSAVE